jgi:tRNA pseudouridine38-40 synthase
MSGLQNYRMTVAYDGTDYAGYQCQPERRTIQGALEQALERITQSPVRVIGAGRTDAGVHAAGLVVSFRSEWRHSTQELERALNAVLPDDVAVREAAQVADSFHARYSAISREYLYRSYESSVRVPYLDRYAWRLDSGLDARILSAASAGLLGEADYRAFGQSVEGRSTVRTIHRAEWLAQAPGRWGVPGWEFWIEANGFLRGMVRRIVGTLVQMGEGGIAPDMMREIVASGDPARAGALAPACGLFFWRARYPGDCHYKDDLARELAGSG